MISKTESWWRIQVIFLLPNFLLLRPSYCWLLTKTPKTLLSRRHSADLTTPNKVYSLYDTQQGPQNRRQQQRHIIFSHPDGAASSEEKVTRPTQQQQTPSSPPSSPLRELYPPSEAYENGTLQVDEIHTLYYEIHGGDRKRKGGKEINDDDTNTINEPLTEAGEGGRGGGGKSALFLHGGPGAGCTPNHARFFNPDVYETIVLFDQRGCGRSSPRGQIYNNTIELLVEDCEILRRHILGDDGKWDVILGGSWGSTLAVAYAQQFPHRIKSLILRGVCLLRRSEVDWLFTPQGGAAQKNPKAWESFAANVGLTSRTTTTTTTGSNIDPSSTTTTMPTISAVGPDDPFSSGSVQAKPKNGLATPTSSAAVSIDRSVLHRYYDRLFGTNTTERWNAARGWMMWEFAVSSSFKKQAQQQADYNAASGPPQSPAVLVSRSNSLAWTYQDAYGRSMDDSQIENLSLDPADVVASRRLRQGLPQQSSSTAAPPPTTILSSPEKARPIGMVLEDFEKAQEEKFGNFSGLPAMPMLTCFYSVNADIYTMSGWDLLDASRMEHIRGGGRKDGQHPTSSDNSIPCIAIQGGCDPICPPDTALDLKDMWPEMEVRIPLSAGHSMYHPELTHELVQATDRMANVI